MREIKFRAKDKYLGDWYYGSYYHEIDFRFGVTTTNDYIITFNKFADMQYNAEIDVDTLGQYTGLKDKNGKKIFEGDIVLVSNQAKAIIMYDDKRAAFVLNYGQDEVPIHSEIYSDLEVIGNVFDNPEWLEGEIKL